MRIEVNMRAKHVFFVVLLCVVVNAATAQDFTIDGPCAYERLATYSQTMPASTGCTGTACSIRVTVTLPKSTQTVACPTGPWPVVAFYNGFQASASSYRAFANRLASYGYSVVQYDTASGTTIVDIVELNFLQQVLNSLAAQSASSSNALFNRVDTTKLAVAGHSRGGKLAALQLAGNYVNPAPKAAYLVDPIDNTQFSPEGPNYPSAAKALLAQNPRKIAGISGAGIISACNPAGTNYPRFVDAVGAGSWLTVLPQATHASFQPASLASLLGICGFGRTSSTETIAITAATMTAWMQATIRGTMVPPPVPAALNMYLTSKVAAGTITFTVKP